MRDTIARLLDDETRTAENWHPPPSLVDPARKPNYQDLYEDLLAAARDLLRCHRANQKDSDLAHWGHWGSLLVPHILSIQRQAIVDLHPISPDEFPSFYGVTFSQFKTLCRHRFIILNVYQDMDIRRNIDGSAYLRHPKLEQLFDKDNFGTRILGVRRERLFSLFFSSNDEIESKFPSFERSIMPTLKNYETEYLDKMLGGARTSTYDGCAKKLFRNIKYICALGSDADREKAVEILEGNVFRSAEPIDGLLRWIRGAKTAVASPITAAFGGMYNCKRHEKTLMDIYLSTTGNKLSAEKHRPAEDVLKYIIDLNMRLSQALSEGISGLEKPVDLPLEDGQFKSFLKWLMENEDLYKRVDKLSQPAKYIVDRSSSIRQMPQIDELSNLLIGVYRERHCPQVVKGLLASLIGKVARRTIETAAGYYITDLVYPDAEPQIKLAIGAGIGAAIGTGIEAAGRYTVKVVLGRKEISSEELAARRVFCDYAANVGGLWELKA